jgi:hypothetical protein
MRRSDCNLRVDQEGRANGLHRSFLHDLQSFANGVNTLDVLAERKIRRERLAEDWHPPSNCKAEFKGCGLSNVTVGADKPQKVGIPNRGKMSILHETDGSVPITCDKQKRPNFVYHARVGGRQHSYPTGMKLRNIRRNHVHVAMKASADRSTQLKFAVGHELSQPGRAA